jgi:hypothetical protein
MGRLTRLGLLLTILSPGLCAEVLAQAIRQSPVSVVINEVMARNSSVIRDPQGQYDDWIELYNPSAFVVDLGGYYLTDDLSQPTKWQIPMGNPAATRIPAGGYLLIWADGDVGDSGLHASFRLSGDGEEVGLFAPDGVTLIDGFSFGPQYVDVSYGRYPNGGPELRFLSVPTPGKPNVLVHEGIAEPPEFDVKGQVCTAPITITLTTATEGATIYYTLDGSEPYSISRDRPFGRIYSEPFVITSTATVKAIAWLPGWRRSDTSTERYIFIAPSVQDFNSNLPLIILDETDGPITSGGRSGTHFALIDRDQDGRARLSGPVTLYSRALANVRGSSSQQFPKKMFGIHLVDDEGGNRKESLLGMPEEHNWVLYAPYSDKSLMRNTIAYGMSNDIGRYAPRTRFVELFLHQGSGLVTWAHYHGVYVLVERIKWGDGRVDIARLSPADNAEPEISGGYILKKDRLNPGEQGLRTSRGTHLAYVRPNEREITANQRKWLIDYLNRLENALFGPGFADPQAGYAAFLDADSFIDLHLITELCKEIDGYRLSTFMHKDRGGKLAKGPLWDFNLSLGNANYLDGWRPQGWYYPLISQDQYLHGWYTRLFQDPESRMRYVDRWFALRREAFATERLLGIIDGYAALLNESQARNFARWPVLGRYIWPNWFIATTYRQEIDWMKDWLVQRLTWMDSQIAVEFAAAPPVFSPQGGHVEAGSFLAMGAPGTIWYTLDGSDPRVAGVIPESSDHFKLIAENAAKRVLVPTGSIRDAWRSNEPFDDSAWISGTGGVGYERSTGFESLININVHNQMYNRNATCYIRIPFHVTAAEIASLGSLTLSVRYDDGFVAYLNGAEVARMNFTGPPAWDSTASVRKPDNTGHVAEFFDITAHADRLQPGQNILAVQALNRTRIEASFLFSVELLAGRTGEGGPPRGVSPGALRYTGPITLSQSAVVKARSLTGDTWSALNEALFAVGPVAETCGSARSCTIPPTIPTPSTSSWSISAPRRST